MRKISYNGSSKIISRIVELLNKKAPLPENGEGVVQWGTSGQVLVTDGQGATSWQDQSGGSEVVVTPTLQSGTKVADVSVDGAAQSIYAPTPPTKLSDLANDTGFITNTVNNLTNYYLSSNTYTKTEVDSLISAIVTLNVLVVQSLPVSDISTTTIYLVPKSTPDTQDVYDEYINLDGTSSGWEHIGSTQIDLSNYYTKTEINALLSAKANTADLAAVATSGSYTDLSNTPTIPAAQVQSDWNQSDSTAVDYIKNKPSIPSGGDTVSWTQVQQSGTKIAEIDINGSTQDVYAPNGGSTYTEGDGIDITNNEISVDTAFTEASTRANIASGDSLATIWGKIKKFFSDLKTVAFTGSYNDLTDKPSVPGGENYVLKAGDTMSGYLSIEPNTDTPLRIKRLSGNSGSRTYMLFSNVSGGMGYYAVGPDKRPWFEPFGGSDERIPLQSEIDAKNFIKDYNDNAPTKFGYSTNGMAQSAATWLAAWDTSVSGEYRLRAVRQADLRVAYATNADTVDGKHLDWSNGGNVGTDVTYLAAWKNDGTLIGWVKRSDISVGSATNAINADYATSASSAGSASFATSADFAEKLLNGNASMEVQSASLKARLVLQSDYNLVLYKNGSAVWSTNTSSRRFKHNIQSMTEERARKILDVRAVTFDWNDGQPVTTQKCDNAGVIAEEVSQIIPDVVVFEQYDNDPNTRIERRVEYERFTPYLIKMVQMQQKQIDTMQATINALEQRLSKLEGK